MLEIASIFTPANNKDVQQFGEWHQETTISPRACSTDGKRTTESLPVFLRIVAASSFVGSNGSV
jgi:hypothetical protein